MMLVATAIDNYRAYHLSNSKPTSIKSFDFTLTRFREFFGDEKILDVLEEDVLTFLDMITEGCKQGTKSSRATVLRAFYNFTTETTGIKIENPCNRPAIKKVYKTPRKSPPKLVDREIIEEIIHRTLDPRDRLMLELMGKAGMRVGEVLTARPRNLKLDNSSLTLENPKSGRVGEKVFLPQKLARKLDTYITENRIDRDDRIFAVSYSTARRMVKAAGQMVGIKLAPHDLRRHAATFASRSGTPIEIVSKVILRHSDLATTQRYLGEVSDQEASRWIEQLHG